MEIIRTTLRSGNPGYKVIDGKGKALFHSFSKIDCEQYMFAKSQPVKDWWK